MRIERLGRLMQGSEPGIELLYKGPDYRWHPSFRAYGPDAARQMEEWYTLNPGRRSNTRLREITRNTPPYDPVQDDDEEQDDMATSRAFDAGKETGAALAGVFEMKAAPDFGAANDLAWAFAKALGYADADSARDFGKAFLSALSTSSPKLLGTSAGDD